MARASDAHAELCGAGEASHGDRWAHLSCALGCEAVLLTSDDAVILLRRSGAVASHAHLLNGPSGHPEPKHMKARHMQTGPTSEGDDGAPSGPGRWAAYRGCRAEDALTEVFAAAVDEIVEETGLPREVRTCLV
jgi:hypothetical protein